MPGPLDEHTERHLRQRAGAILNGGGDGGATSSFVALVLEEVCGLDSSTGTWERGNRVAPSWGRRAITGETVKPRQLWTSREGGRLPVFLDDGRRLGVGRGRRAVSQVLDWLRAGNDHLALVTNGRRWRGVSQGGSPPDDETTVPAPVVPEEIYRAACRVGMRLVVILFAESRELLPRDNALYHESYGLNGLLEGLERDAARGGALGASFAAWPRALALFRLVRDGSHHPDLPVTAYDGDLFAPGASDLAGRLSRALFVFENACFEGEALPDRDVHEMLKLLARTTIRIRQGRGGTRAVVPVDFSDLSSEYIGILYERLLDHELKTAPSRDPVIFLAVGDQPALPLSRLEAMEDQPLKTLFERFKESSSAADDVP